MPRPQFTREEEALISYIRIQDQSRAADLVHWLIWVAASSALFFYGFLRNVEECVFAGFVIALYQLCRFIYYEFKPSWRLGPIIDKYEEACREGNQPAH